MASSSKPDEMVELIKQAVKLAKKGECNAALKAASKAYTIRRGPTVAVGRYFVQVAKKEYDGLRSKHGPMLYACALQEQAKVPKGKETPRHLALYGLRRKRR